jgi:glycosyltransferase involved in cell wall biosynthesis
VRTVLFTTFTSYTVGGLLSREARLAPLLARHGWRAVFGLAWGERFHDPAAFRRAFPDLETLDMDGRTGTRPGRLMAIDRTIARVRPDVVLPDAMIDTFEVVMQRKLSASSPRLVAGLPGLHPDYMLMLSAYAGIVDRAFGVSRHTARALRDLCDIPPQLVDTIPSGVPLPTRSWQPRTDRPIRLGYVGRLASDKRPLDAVSLACELERRGVNYSLDIYGAGDLHANVIAEAEAAQVKGLQVRGALSVTKLYEEVYPSLDALLLFSPSEGNPNALLESMVHGVVPICSDFAGRAEEGLLRHGDTALVFPIGDISAAARLVDSLSADRELQRRLAVRGQSEALTRHSLEAMSAAFAGMLDSATEQEPRVDRIHVRRGTPRSRLERFCSPQIAEFLRRMSGYRFPHSDASEWPSTEVFNGRMSAPMAERLRLWLGIPPNSNRHPE